MGFTSDVELHLDSLAKRHQIGATTKNELHRNGYLLIRRGIYLPRSCIPPKAPRWQIRQMVTKARALSASLSRRGTPPPVLTLEAALLLHGLNTWTNTSDICFRIDGNHGARRGSTLPPVRVDGVDVGVVGERQLLSAVPRPGVLQVAGGLTESLVTVAVDCARFLHPLPALVAVSSVLAQLSGFDRWHQERVRIRENEARKSMRAQLGLLVGRRGTRRAAFILEAADAGLQTPGEGFMWWLLHCMLPERHACGLVTQLPVEVEGRRYFPDAGLPEHGILFEFDGFGKMPETEKEFLSRQRAIAWAGWTSIRVDQGQLSRPGELVAHLLRELRGCGIDAHHPRGPLWKPLTDELLAPDRRF